LLLNFTMIRVLRAIDLTDLEDPRWVIRLESVHVDAQVSDLLERSLPRELPQEADTGDDRYVRRVAAGDAGLQGRRVVRAFRVVRSGDARLRLEGIEHLLEGVLLAAAPERHDRDRAAGRSCSGRVAARRTSRRDQ
jgi:hypothetical protein